MNRLIALEELVLKCRDERVRAYVEEAIACYNAGAFRSAIIATWTAVTFDYIHKLHELDLSGDRQAQKYVNSLQKIRENDSRNYGESLKFEKELLDRARNEFELITQLEFEDLDRLRQDRNRCAHPTMQTDEESYSPTPELARNHIRNAVEILIQREPVQGKAALERVLGEVNSVYFPDDPEKAIQALSSGPMKRPRDTLFRSLFLAITKKYFSISLQEDFPTRKRLIMALVALGRMHPNKSKVVLVDKGLAHILDTIPDENLRFALIYLGKVPDAWNLTTDRIRIRIEEFVKNGPQSTAANRLHIGFIVPALKDRAEILLQGIDAKGLAEAISYEPYAEYLERAIELYSNSGSFASAKYNADYLIMPLVGLFDGNQICKIIDAIGNTHQILHAGGIPEFAVRLYKETSQHIGLTRVHWQELKSVLTYDYSNLISLLESDEF